MPRLQPAAAYLSTLTPKTLLKGPNNKT